MLVCADESYLTNGYLETSIDWIPGLKNVRLRDIPTLIRTTDPNDIVLNFMITQLDRARKASAIILNAFDALESETLDAIKPLLSPLYTIGPIHLLHRQLSEKG
ncbi:hypothetical protein IFM89_003719 [Coptis chinensis]|uniref:Uncharacterized protein n=1 Tax=Coptis chinensis TaxID=261450 RepID=A0A835HXD7_9MAGN|nr:hypothetical protein IFM89_003719 [Coptis chinensis]